GNGVFGVQNVARLLATFGASFLQIGGTVHPRPLNGHPGAIVRDRDGNVVHTLALDILDGQVQTIRAVPNPDKPQHLGPGAGAYSGGREADQGGRPPSRPMDPSRQWRSLDWKGPGRVAGGPGWPIPRATSWTR